MAANQARGNGLPNGHRRNVSDESKWSTQTNGNKTPPTTPVPNAPVRSTKPKPTKDDFNGVGSQHDRGREQT